MTAFEFTGPGLTAEQWEKIKGLAVSLAPNQALWISGYFAGLHDARTAGVAQLAEPPLPLSAPGGAVAASTRTLTILYGSETGNSAALAREAAEGARQRGLAPTVVDMADYKPRKLKEEQDLLIVTSTYGEGDPPQMAVDFFEFVESRKAPKLPDLRFAVLALGDSSYERYCEAGKRLDRRFEELGATRLEARVDCDVDYETPAAAWIAATLAALGGGAAAAGQVPAAAAANTGAGAAAAFDKRNPFPAAVIDNLVLSGRGSSKEVRHIELSLDGSGLAFEPGDALGVVPQNDPAVAAAILDSLALAADAPVTLKDGPVTVGAALETAFEITTATPRFLTHWAELSGAAELARLGAEDQAEARAAFLHDHHVIDIIRRFPVPGLDAQTFVSGLRPLQPRLYSIASSLAAQPDEVHLTVATVRYDLHGEARAGVASGHFADRLGTDGEIPVYVQANPHFRLPADDVPVVMIGAGTGVAPYRAFLQERESRGAGGRSWLFFGDRNFRTDFLYQTEWQGFLKDGVLTRMDVAFSRDGQEKTYVQHRLHEQAADLFAWLEDGAHVYVCGDATSLAPDVHEALIAIIEQAGGLSRDAAEDYIRSLQRDRRYQRDVY